MTFETSPSAIDGAQLTSALVRRATFAGVNGNAGIVLKGDLKVSQLGTPGVGIQIAAGVGLVLNGYQTTPNEIYVVSNPGVHTVPSGQMPGSIPSAKSYIVAVVVGDPDFSQSSHPWMLSTDPPVGQELTFAYVRVTLVEVANNTVTSLPAGYPGLALARIDVPASTTTIIDSYITDLRHLAQSRQSQTMIVSPANQFSSAQKMPNGSAYANWSTWAPTVAVPSWAKRCVMALTVTGAYLADSSQNSIGGMRPLIGAVAGPATSFDIPSGVSGASRLNALVAGGEFDVSSIAGTTPTLRLQGFQSNPASPTANQTVDLRSGSQAIFDIRFFEE